MSQTTINLGFVPKNREIADWDNLPAGTKFYKDNIVQFKGSSYICSPMGYDPEHHTDSFVTVEPWTESPQVLNAGWKVFASGNNKFTTGESVDGLGIDQSPQYGSSGLITSKAVAAHGSAFDISEYNKNGNTLATYANLADALAAVPAAAKRGGMSIKFIQTITPAKYTVVKTEGATEQPAGTELQNDPGIISGTYTAGELSVFSTLPATLNSSLTYYLAVTETVDEQEVTTYTTWVITYVHTYDNKYVQYRLMSNTFNTTLTNWQGVDDEPTAGSNNLITSDAVYNESKKSDVILAIDKTDLSTGYYYDNTTGEKVANTNCWSNLIDIPAKTKEINVIWGGPDSTVAFFGIAIYDAPIAELTDENISDHFIKGFTGRDLLEVSRIIVNDSYKSIAVTIGNTFSSQVLFNALESCIHYGSRLLDVFYLNDNSVRSMVGKSVYLRTLDKTTGIVSLRDPVTGADYNVQSTVKKGKELLLSKDDNYVYLGVLVDWDIVDYNFSNISQAADNTFVLSIPKSAEGQKFFDMIYNKKYRQTGNTTVNGDGVVSGFDCVWEDGTAGHVAYNTFDGDVLEYRSSIVTYGTSYAVYYGLKTFDEYGNITSETGLEIRVI